MRHMGTCAKCTSLIVSGRVNELVQIQDVERGYELDSGRMAGPGIWECDMEAPNFGLYSECELVEHSCHAFEKKLMFMFDGEIFDVCISVFDGRIRLDWDYSEIHLVVLMLTFLVLAEWFSY